MKNVKTVVLFAGTNARSRGTACMLGHLECVPKFQSKNCKMESFDIDAPQFRLTDAKVASLTRQRAVVVLLICKSFVANPLAGSKQLKALIDQSGAQGAHIFPIYCEAVEEPERLPWAIFQWTPQGKPIAACQEMDSVCNNAIHQLDEVVLRRQRGAVAVPELAVFAGHRNQNEVERGLAPFLQMARGLDFAYCWQILPGEIPAEFYERIAQAKRQVVFVSADCLADNFIWCSAVAKEPTDDQTRLMVPFYACRWESVEHLDSPAVKVVPDREEPNDGVTVGGKNSHALWLRVYQALADLVNDRP